jgi:hypothetical protein
VSLMKTIGAAVAAVATCSWLGYWIYSYVDAGNPNGHLPRDFPNAYLAPADNGHADRMRVWRGRVPPNPPVEIDGVDCWPAYACMSKNCIWQEQHGEPWIFAFGWDPKAPENARPVSWCVPCAKAGRDSSDVHFTTTEEGERILGPIRERLSH